MKSTTAVAVAAGLLIGGGGARVAAEEGTLPGGSAVTVDITSPADGTIVEYGTDVPVEGVAAVATAPADKNTDLVFVLDTSGSVGNGAGVDCDGIAGNDSIYTCERYGVLELAQQAAAPRSPISRIGVEAFPGSGFIPYPLGAVDVGALTTNLLTTNAITPSGGTNFSTGLSKARSQLTGSVGEQLVIFLTDGVNGSIATGEVGIPSALIKVFPIAGATCIGTNAQLASLGAEGSSCKEVAALTDLAETITEEIEATLDSATVTVDQSVDGLASPGATPLTTSFAPTVAGEYEIAALASAASDLAVGINEICASVSGTDPGGSGTVTDCITVTMAEEGTVIIECGEVEGECSGSAVDPGKSTLSFNAPEDFDETVTIIPGSGEPGECGGSDCRTGYDVLFETTEGNVRASITVVTDDPVRPRDRLRAAVFIDDVRVHPKCNEGTLIGQIREAAGIPEPLPCATIRYTEGRRLEYYVEFGADPKFRFQ